MVLQLFYSLPELADRWNKKYDMNISAKHIIHLGLQELIDIDISISKLIKTIPDPISIENSITIFGLQAYEYHHGSEDFDKPIAGCLLDTAPVSSTSLYEIASDFPEKESDTFHLGYIELKTKSWGESRRIGLVSSDASNIKLKTYRFGDAPSIDIIYSDRTTEEDESCFWILDLNLNCFSVSQATVRAYEEVLGNPTSASTVREISESKEQTYLAIIAAMVKLIAEAPAKPRNQARVVADLANLYGQSVKGLSEDTLKKTFAAANKALSERLKENNKLEKE